MKLSIFSKITAKYPQETDMDKIVCAIRESKRIKSFCEERRKLLVKGRINQADNIKKTKIPVFFPGAFLFDGKGRKNVIGLTNLCFLETDHISEELILEAKGLLRKDNHIVLCYRSMSNEGLHFLVKYIFMNMETPSYKNMGLNRMNHTYGAVFTTLKDYYQELLGVSIDPSGANMERLCLLAADKDVYYNPDATPVIIEYQNQDLKKKPKTLQFEV